MKFSRFNVKHGGDGENRTRDPLLARQVLSQLSYAPGLKKVYNRFLSCQPSACCVDIHLYSLLAVLGLPQTNSILAIFLAHEDLHPHAFEQVALFTLFSCWVGSMLSTKKYGGPNWTRTSDLTLIRRAL